MKEALFWGLVASSSLLVGGVLALRVRVGTEALGIVMGFGAGVLISAVAYELVLEGFESSAGLGGVALGLAAGCATFSIGDALVDRMGGEQRKHSGGLQSDGVALAIVLGIVLDGIPESVALGVGLLSGAGISTAMLVAVFLSNLPESIAATTGLAAAGWAHRRIIELWLLVTAVSGLAALAGYVLLDGASGGTVAFVLAFAGGAILTMLADTMMPEAYRHGGKLVGVFTTLGFALAFWVGSLD